MNEEINKVVLENTPKNAQYIEPKIQKELLNIIANKVRHKIREEVVVNVDETKALTLKDEICNVLAQYNLLVENLRGQGEKEIIDLIALKELEIGTGANQVRTLQRARDTRWSSHFTSVSRFIEMFGATLEVLGKMINDGSSRDMRGLKTKSLDILNALNYVSSTKRLLQEFRDSIERSCQQKDYVTVEHHYHFDVFNAVIDFQLMELNSRFSEQTVELLTLSSALDLVDGFK
ncbi:uncharacterized protein LOC102613881 [Citrus sinensis]|uniref:uncharacterized protein LOC102613881 n=1 Tax=Citrus sinensis TaxID=2711 RepID=UPI000D6290B9|nr:uncharacterized protein LOC102613881 [Citrus sinensis]